MQVTANPFGGVAAPDYRIDTGAGIGHVHLTVADLDRQIAFYERVLGFKLHWREGSTAGLGAGQDDLLRLTEDAGARRAGNTTGMYHFAVLFPGKRELARAVARLFALRYPNYPTDHVSTQTTYLTDPEGNEIELYADTPEEGIWTVNSPTSGIIDGKGRLRSGRDPLDIEELFSNLEPDDRLDSPLPEGTRLGHMHLYVASLEATLHFYHELLGFDNMGASIPFRMGMVSAGGYHHHIGFNTWRGESAPPPPAGSLGMRYFTVLLSSQPELEQFTQRLNDVGVKYEQTPDGLLVRDPSQNAVVFTTRKS